MSYQSWVTRIYLYPTAFRVLWIENIPIKSCGAVGLYLVKGVNGCRCIMGTHAKFNKAYYSGNIPCNCMELWISWNRTGNLISGKLIEWAIVESVQCYSTDFQIPIWLQFPWWNNPYPATAVICLFIFLSKYKTNCPSAIIRVIYNTSRQLFSK